MSDFLPPPPASGSSPPGYVPYGAMGGPAWPAARTYDVRGLALALSIVLPLVAVLAAALAYAHFDRAALVEDTFSGGFQFDFDRVDELDAADSRVGGLLGGYVLAVVAVAAVWIVWQWRHASNALALGARGGLGPPWAIAGWFIPIGSFVLPGLQLHQSSRASDPTPPPGRPGRGQPIVLVWMVAWALAGILLAVGSGMEPNGDARFTSLDDLVDDQMAADRVMGAGALLVVVAAALAVVMVRRLSRLQTAALDRHRATVATPSAPVAPWAAPPPPQPSPWAPPPPVPPPPDGRPAPPM